MSDHVHALQRARQWALDRLASVLPQKFLSTLAFL